MFRILILSVDDLIMGDKVLMMMAQAAGGKRIELPCKLQMQVGRQWVDIPFEKMSAHPYVKADKQT